jgi:hypothetical protein
LRTLFTVFRVWREEMKRLPRRYTMRSNFLAVAFAIVLGCALAPAAVGGRAAAAPSVRTAQDELERVRPVSGSGVHYWKTAIVHSSEATETGMIQTSTETIDLSGDLTGRILYQPTTVIDFTTGTLVNTGHQVFSGTVLGSAPVMLHDDEFRFDVNIATGTGAGTVYLTDNIAGPKIRCELDVITTGMTPEDDVTADYTGFCRFKND